MVLFGHFDHSGGFDVDRGLFGLCALCAVSSASRPADGFVLLVAFQKFNAACLNPGVFYPAQEYRFSRAVGIIASTTGNSLSITIKIP
jgi:hypothetical protein